MGYNSTSYSVDDVGLDWLDTDTNDTITRNEEMGNTPSSPASGGSPNVARHGSLGKHHHSRHSSAAQPQGQGQNTARQASPSALPHHRTTHLQDSFPVPSPRSPLSQRQPVEVTTADTSPQTSSTSTVGPTSPITQGNAVSPSSLRPGSSPRRRKSLELPDLNRLSLTMATPTLDATAAMNADQATPSRSIPLRSNPPQRNSPGGYVPDSVQQGAQGSGQGNRVSLMTGTRADASGASGNQGGKEFVQDNPYFPPVLSLALGPVAGSAQGQQQHQRTVGTPSLPNYSCSPTDSDSGLPHTHTEDINAPLNANSSSSSATASTTAAGRTMSIHQPRAGVPAPAVVTRDTHDHDPIPVQRGMVGNVSQEGRQRVREGDEGDVTPLAFRDPVTGEGGGELQAQQQQQAVPSIQAAAPAQAQQETTSTTSQLVPTLVTWNGGGKEVYVTGTFAENGWRTRLKMNKSLLVDLPPGTHRIKFIVDDHWRCAPDLQTATDGDGNLVNWLEVSPLPPVAAAEQSGGKGKAEEEEDWAMADWAQKVRSELDDDDPSLWTDEIPWALVEFQQMEEEALSDPPADLPPSQHRSFHSRCSTILSQLPVPPALPPHLNKVILNVTPRELEGTVGGAAGDDNSILPVPNHVVLNHLTASAIKNDTLAVGTTTRYRKKYISTIYFKPVEA
ncbi:hypothetical protein QFC22_000357 [Naganishia vaughanmartiniae]|uniref:Uncharacterized protein n=1 Tax=Naganishia vaughanmartiniae TaxID=1424756 RepID=A0ACC2XQ37_9TREE|nr:hypothetical protein QFC22_000357 [Naganishia vaughanmartiniae]